MAGCYDHTWRVGSNARGTRSQFRLNTQSILPFKCPSPLHLPDAMELGSSSQTGHLSPIQGTLTRTVREYEQTIDELKKENFELKLRIYLIEEDVAKHYRRINAPDSDDKNASNVHVAVDLKVETESLRNELNEKNKLLQDALDQAEKYASDLKELQDEYVQLQAQFSSFTEGPSLQDLELLEDKKENLLKETEYLKGLLSEKDKEVEVANSRAEEFENQVQVLKEKVKKSSMAIQGLVCKYHNDVEMIPKELRPIIQSAVTAANNENREDLAAAIENFKASLNQLMPTPPEICDSSSERSRSKHESSQLEDTHGHTQAISSLNASESKYVYNEKSDSLLSESRSLNHSQKAENISVDLSAVLKENEELKSEIEEKLATINDLTATCNDLEQRTIQLQTELHDAIEKVKQYEMKPREEKGKHLSPLLKTSTYTQTCVQWHLLQSNISEKSLINAGHTNNIDELKEEILTLLLVIEQKDKELSDMKQELDTVQDYVKERKDLLERLASSCSVNNELMRHLRKLGNFLEDLLQNKSFDASSLENISETSEFLSQLSRCLDESLKLSHVLSDNLSMSETRIIDSDISVSKDNVFGAKSLSYPHLHSSLTGQALQELSILPDEGRNFQPSYQESFKNFAGTGKRRWSLSAQHNSVKNSSVMNSENVIVLRTSSNEDLILLLNKNGDPADVLLRSKQSHLNQNIIPPVLGDGDQLRRRCLENNSMLNTTYWNSQTSNFHQYAGDLCNVENKDAKSNVAWYNQCLSSDSDIWSEPDRDISMQRIGIDVKTSPTAQKSPRRSRFKDRRTTEELSSEKNTSNNGSFKIQSWSRRRRSGGTASKRLFVKENMGKRDYKLDKHFSVLSEKFPPLCSLMEQLQKINESKKSSAVEDIYDELHGLMSTVNETLLKLSVLKENSKSLVICEKCAVHELLLELDKTRKRICGSDVLQNLTESNAEKVIHKFLMEVDALKKELEEPHAILSSGAESSEYESGAAKKTEQFDNSFQDPNLNNLKNRLKEAEDENNKLENKIKEMKEVFQKEKNITENLKTEKLELANLVNQLKEEISDLNEKKKALMLQNSHFKQELIEANGTSGNLKSVIKDLETKVLESSNMCDSLKEELGKSKEQLINLDAKCYEQDLRNSSKEKSELNDMLKTVEVNAVEEKNKVLNDVKKLVDEKNDLLMKLKTEKDKTKFLEKEKIELSDKLIKNEKENSLLHVSIKELKDSVAVVLKEKDLLKAELTSSNSVCDELSNDLVKMREKLEKMEVKCFSYEKDLQTSSYVKQDFINKLLHLKNEILLNVTRLNDACKEHLKVELGSHSNEDSPDNVTRFDLVADNQIENLFKGIISEINKFAKIIRTLEHVLENTYSKIQESRSSEEKHKLKIEFLAKELESKKFDTEKLKNEIDRWKSEVDEKVQIILDKENTLKETNLKIVSLNEKLGNAEEQIQEKIKHLNLKDDELTKLQEIIFNLQTQINKLLSEKMNFDNRRLSFSKSVKDVATSPSHEFGVLHEQMSTVHQAVGTEDEVGLGKAQQQSGNDSFSSQSSKEDKDLESTSMHKKINEKLIKKIKALEAKLSMCEKRADILEKEKNDLRNSVLEQVHSNKRISGGSEDLSQKITDLELKLEKKNSFIKELKSELHRTCNSLVDKQKEVDDLEQKLSEYVNIGQKYETEHRDIATAHSEILQSNTEAQFLELRRHKWDLIQEIFKLQKHFYEEREIHVGHFEKFKNYIITLHSRQKSFPWMKSGSEPLLNSLQDKVADNLSQNRILEYLNLDLDIDIECLQNLKIFLKRFFMPQISKKSQHSLPETNDPNLGDTSISVKKPTEISEISKQSKEFENILCKKPSEAADFIRSFTDAGSHSKENKLENSALIVSQKLDFVENTLKGLQAELKHLNEIHSSAQEMPAETSEKSLLMELSDKIAKLLEKSEVFTLNSTLKSLPMFINSVPCSPTKQDMSDRESLLSEETITLSRSGSLSPVSFEENLPSKTKTVQMAHVKESEKGLKRNVLNVTDVPYNQTTVGNSQDSVCHRSHYSSPDLGIESDPNHEGSAPEQQEETNRNESTQKSKQKIARMQLKSMHSYSPNEARLKNIPISLGVGDTLHAIGILQEYELLKREVQEGLVGIQSVLSRTGDGLHHIAKYTSPRKNLEYSTLKAIKDTCANIEVCLREAYKLVNNFWIAPCPSVQEWNILIQQNQEQNEQLTKLKTSMDEQEKAFKDALEKLKLAELRKESMERKISKKLVKTKKIIRQAELKLLEKQCQNLPFVNKYNPEEAAYEGTL
ncbi:CDK5 regulatory subunit-associated protein 2-like isoform X2 [Stegodyphus dumicola]|uniref:CDK5 regulatory subunit-associated protein 2-like isoform X2 n=1 Tax=Stegodyphus dumicola TaxID=202533 RepID=UPI0015A8F340|nr:CDK5 regulatory subunit-associated protein 2-like isoform X2 [Stegodyphus dumicola]